MKCPHCGEEIPDSSKFCRNCGKKVSQQKPKKNSQMKWRHESEININLDDLANDDDPFEDNDDPFQNDRSKYVKVGIIGIILLIIIFMVVMVFKSKKDGSSATGTSSSVSSDDSAVSVDDNADSSDSDAAAQDATVSDDASDQAVADSSEENYNFPDNSTYFEANGHHYAIFDYTDVGLLDDFDAWEQYCEDQGGHMATIENQEENDFIYSYVKSLGYTLAFFGYTDERSEGNWEWVDGSQTTYTNWAYGQPNDGAKNKDNSSEDYAQFYKDSADGTWNDSKIAVNTYKFICEWDY